MEPLIRDCPSFKPMFFLLLKPGFSFHYLFSCKSTAWPRPPHTEYCHSLVLGLIFTDFCIIYILVYHYQQFNKGLLVYPVQAWSIWWWTSKVLQLRWGWPTPTQWLRRWGWPGLPSGQCEQRQPAVWTLIWWRRGGRGGGGWRRGGGRKGRCCCSHRRS